SLMDLGFTETQSVQLLKSVSDRREPVATQRLAMLSAFVAVGLNPSSVLKVLDKCPELHRMKVVQLQQRIDNLRKLGLLEGSLQRVLSHCPQLLTRTPKALNTAVRVLRERCHFSGQQVTDILRDTPATLLEDMAQVEYKFQYAYFRMGVRQAEMIKSGLFRVSLDEVRSRHAYLECLGLFETPDKKGQTRVANPKLRDFLGVPEKTFVAEVARTTLEEFEVFKRLLARKQQEEEREEEEQLDSGSEEEEEEEDGESEEDSDSEDSDHSTGYRRSKK
ncbi:MTEF4 factor, partial [Amia calva]|nr:MTEF4 factor [Amia calva]